MATVLSIIAFEENAAPGQGEVAALHLRPGLSAASTASIALHLATVAQSLITHPDYRPPSMLAPSNLGPPPSPTEVDMFGPPGKA